eukprot:9500168-Pyramimonas_sp.AAC.1
MMMKSEVVQGRLLAGELRIASTSSTYCVAGITSVFMYTTHPFNSPALDDLGRSHSTKLLIIHRRRNRDRVTTTSQERQVDLT